MSDANDIIRSSTAANGLPICSPPITFRCLSHLELDTFSLCIFTFSPLSSSPSFILIKYNSQCTRDKSIVCIERNSLIIRRARWISIREFRVTDFTENLHTLRDASNANDADKSRAKLSMVQLQLGGSARWTWQWQVQQEQRLKKDSVRWILLIIITFEFLFFLRISKSLKRI